MRFSPGWKISVTVLALLPLLVSLGNWQARRAYEKREILGKIEQRRAASPMELSKLESLEDLAYRQVVFSGHYIDQRVVLLDNRMVEGQFGYEWVHLFRTDEQSLLAISRGWLPGSLSREILPQLPPVPKRQTLTAEIYVPLGSPVKLAEEKLAPDWPKRVQVLDLEALSLAMGEPVFPFVLRLHSLNESALYPHWQDINVQPAKHDAYAFQWYAMSVALLLMYLGLGFGVQGSRRNGVGKRDAT